MAMKKDDAFMEKTDVADLTATRITTGLLTADPSSKPVVSSSISEIVMSGRFAVRLDPQHPAGQYNRAGVKFISGQDVFFDTVPEAIQADPWLMVAKVEGDAPPVYRSAERREKQAARQL